MSRTEHRYLVITELFLPTKGGTAIWFDNVYRLLGRQGIHVVTAAVEGASEHDKFNPNSIHRITLQRHWWLRPESLAMYTKLLTQSFSLCWQHSFEAIHAGRVLPEGLIGLVCGKWFRLPVVIYAHGEEITTWRQLVKFKVMQFTYKKANWIIANSTFTHQELLKLGVQEEKIRLISPGVDVARFRPEQNFRDLLEAIHFGPDQKLILSVGRLSRRKGFDQVIRALPHLIAGGVNVRYAIVGIGQDLEYLESLSRSVGMADRVHFLGPVDQEDLPRWYNAADVFAMPNRDVNGDTEGFGMVYLEAAACGKPSLAGEAGGTAGAVQHGVTGLRVDGESVEEITQALKYLLTNEGSAKMMGRNGLNRVRSEFSWEAVAQKLSGIGLNQT